MNKPLSLSLNIAMATICSRLFPCGFDVAETAPSSLAELNACVAETGRITVWNGASDRTVYGSTEHNFMFRAWHDWCHWKAQSEFTLAGERDALAMQLNHLATVYPSHPDSKLWEVILEAEVIGQATYHEETGEFPIDQLAFTTSLVEERLAA